MKIKELPGSFIYDTLINKSVYFFNGRMVRWMSSWIELLLLTVTDGSTTCAIVTFRVNVSRQSGYWPDWSIKSRRSIIGRLLVKPWCFWLWRLVMSLVRFDPCLLSQLNSRFLLVKLSVVSESITLNLLMKWLLGSNLSQMYRSLKPLGWNTSRPRKRDLGNVKIHP